MLMTDEQVDRIERHALLYANHGDTQALTPDDVVAMITEIREARQAVRHLIAEKHQALVRGWWSS